MEIKEIERSYINRDTKETTTDHATAMSWYRAGHVVECISPSPCSCEPIKLRVFHNPLFYRLTPIVTERNLTLWNSRFSRQ